MPKSKGNSWSPLFRADMGFVTDNDNSGATRLWDGDNEDYLIGIYHTDAEVDAAQRTYLDTIAAIRLSLSDPRAR
jgi:hypothetical protein